MSRRRSPAAAVGAAALPLPLPPLHALSMNPVGTVKTADIGAVDEQELRADATQFEQNPSYEAFREAVLDRGEEYAVAFALEAVRRDGWLLMHLFKILGNNLSYYFIGQDAWERIAHHAVQQNGSAVVVVDRYLVLRPYDGVPKLLLEAMESDNPAQPASLYDHMMFHTQMLRHYAQAEVDTKSFWQWRNRNMPEHWMVHFEWFQTLNKAYYEELEEGGWPSNRDVWFGRIYYTMRGDSDVFPYQSELHRGEPLFRLDYIDHPENARDVGVIDSVVHGLFNKTSTGVGYTLAAAGGFAEYGLANNPVFCSYMLTSILRNFESTVPLQYIYRWVWTFSDSPEIGTSWKPALGSPERVRLVHQLLHEDARAWFESELQRQFVAGDDRLLLHVVRAMPYTWDLLPAASPLRNDVELMLDAALAPDESEVGGSEGGGSREAAVALVKRVHESVRDKPPSRLRRSVANAFKYILGLGDDETLDELDALYAQETAYEAVNDLMVLLAKRHPPLPPPKNAPEDYEDDLTRTIRELLEYVNRPDGALGRMDKREREAVLDDARTLSRKQARRLEQETALDDARRQARRLDAFVAYYNGRHTAARRAVLRLRSRPARMGRV